jgi:excisionase family DNA binding protein
MKIIVGTRYYTVSELATQFGRSEQTISRWIKEGKLNGTKCGNLMLFTEEDVKKFIEISHTGGDDAACNNN